MNGIPLIDCVRRPRKTRGQSLATTGWGSTAPYNTHMGDTPLYMVYYSFIYIRVEVLSNRFAWSLLGTTPRPSQRIRLELHLATLLRFLRTSPNALNPRGSTLALYGMMSSVLVIVLCAILLALGCFKQPGAPRCGRAGWLPTSYSLNST